MKYKDYKEILEIISTAGRAGETVEIYYPETDTKKSCWREVEPYSLSTDVPSEGEHLIPPRREKKGDTILPGHIFNGYTLGVGDRHCHSFIIGKIKNARLTRRKFSARKNWKIEF